MDAVILFSHGSVLCGSGEALDAHAQRLQDRGIAPLVTVGYLNYSTPPFLEAVETCVVAGAKRILIVPYFLVPGKFVQVDLPAAIDRARALFPTLLFEVAEAIGFEETLADALIDSAHAAAPPESWNDDLQRAVRSCRANPACPLFGAPECPAAKSGS